LFLNQPNYRRSGTRTQAVAAAAGCPWHPQGHCLLWPLIRWTDVGKHRWTGSRCSTPLACESGAAPATV